MSKLEDLQESVEQLGIQDTKHAHMLSGVQKGINNLESALLTFQSDFQAFSSRVNTEIELLKLKVSQNQVIITLLAHTLNTDELTCISGSAGAAPSPIPTPVVTLGCPSVRHGYNCFERPGKRHF